MKALRFVTLLFLVARFLVAQTPAQSPATGSITGHVYLGDSHLPARMAYVTLLPAIAADAKEKTPPASSATVQAGLDGSYIMNNVLPGTYYVVAGKLGYATTVPTPFLDPDL